MMQALETTWRWLRVTENDAQDLGKAAVRVPVLNRHEEFGAALWTRLYMLCCRQRQPGIESMVLQI